MFIPLIRGRPDGTGYLHANAKYIERHEGDNTKTAELNTHTHTSFAYAKCIGLETTSPSGKLSAMSEKVYASHGGIAPWLPWRSPKRHEKKRHVVPFPFLHPTPTSI